MRKILFAVAVLALLAPMTAQAQSTVGVSATIDKSATWSGTQDLQFQTVSSAGKTVLASDATYAGKRTLTYNYPLTIGFSGVPATLSSGTATLAVTLNCALDTGSGFGSETACSSASYPLLSALTTAKTATVGVGGAIAGADAAVAPAGTYSGSITITVTP